MGRKTTDIEQKVTEIKEILERYGRIPNQTEDRAAHATIKYYLKHYENEPQIQKLMVQYNLRAGKDKEDHLKEVSSLLKEHGRIPTVKENLADYGKIRYFFQKYSDLSEVIKLKYIYTHINRVSLFLIADLAQGQSPLHAIFMLDMFLQNT
jgi:hypothetical protein